MHHTGEEPLHPRLHRRTACTAFDDVHDAPLCYAATREGALGHRAVEWAHADRAVVFFFPFTPVASTIIPVDGLMQVVHDYAVEPVGL